MALTMLSKMYVGKLPARLSQFSHFLLDCAIYKSADTYRMTSERASNIYYFVIFEYFTRIKSQISIIIITCVTSQLQSLLIWLIRKSFYPLVNRY